MNFIDVGISKIELAILKNHTWSETDLLLHPLKWYIYTGRASAAVCHKIFEKPPYMIARKLCNNGNPGSIQESVDRILRYIGER